MSADVGKLPAYVGMPIADSGYLLVRISKVTAGQTSAQQAGQAGERAAGLMGSAQYDAYVASLRERADVDINRNNLEKR